MKPKSHRKQKACINCIHVVALETLGSDDYACDAGMLPATKEDRVEPEDICDEHYPEDAQDGN